MGVYARYKRDPDGFRKLVELLELTPKSRRQKMIDVGMQEDPAYTKKAMKLIMTFEDILGLPDHELVEVLGETQPQFIGYAIHRASDEIKKRFLSKALPKVAIGIKETLELTNVSVTQIGTGQMKLVESARKLEKQGVVKTKKIEETLVGI